MLTSILRRFIPLAVIITCLCGLFYLSIQQTLRIGANDPQIQLAEDTAVTLSTQNDTVQITSLPRIDISTSLSPFVIIYDADGMPVSSSGQLDDKIPTIPRGVFAYSKEHNSDRFTWQPKNGVRIAAVMQHFTGRTTGYVLAGRSLREVENREDSLAQQVGLGLVVSLVLTLFAVIFTSTSEKKKR